MASPTGIPENAQNTPQQGYAEDEPLLGQQGDASQQEGKPLYYNLFLGTAPLAQAGVLLLFAHIWAAILLSPFFPLFTPHPLLNSLALLLLVQSILILQPTHTASQKRNGTLVHFTLNVLFLLTFLSAFIVILINKIQSHHEHFASPHAILGLITYILIFMQAAVGVVQYFFPKQMFGSVDKGKSIYKYHRASGYLILVLGLGTVVAATYTGFNKSVLGVKDWAVILSGVLVLVGLVPRIKKQKFGFGR